MVEVVTTHYYYEYYYRLNIILSTLSVIDASLRNLSYVCIETCIFIQESHGTRPLLLLVTSSNIYLFG
ncbi:MAG: hypothetical protein [Cotesia congregata filamentous virus 2]